MPVDWEDRVFTKDPNKKTTFAVVRIDDPLTCFKFFGKYTDRGDTILIC